MLQQRAWRVMWDMRRAALSRFGVGTWVVAVRVACIDAFGRDLGMPDVNVEDGPYRAMQTTVAVVDIDGGRRARPR